MSFSARVTALELYPRLIGEAWARVAPQVRAMHSAELRAEGTMTITHGRSAAARWLARRSGAPDPGERVPVSLHVTADGERQRWSRRYGERDVTTLQLARAGCMVEVYRGLGVHFRFELDREGALIYRQTRATLELGPISLPLPACVAPRARGRVAPGASPDSAEVDVSVAAPLVGMLVSYRGTMRVEAARLSARTGSSPSRPPRA